MTGEWQKAESTPFRRALRRRQTEAEAVLWRHLRDRQMMGAKFRRQHRFGPFVLDFCCPERGLVVEVDGGQHYDEAGLAYDERRTRYLERWGMRVMRFGNLEVLLETDAVLRAIEEALGAPSP